MSVFVPFELLSPDLVPVDLTFPIPFEFEVDLKFEGVADRVPETLVVAELFLDPLIVV